MGMVEPRLKRRRGTSGLYAQPRNMLGADPRRSIGRDAPDKGELLLLRRGPRHERAFPDLADFSAKQRLEEVREVGAEVLVSACPWCKNNFGQAVKENGDNVKVMDISEVILASL